MINKFTYILLSLFIFTSFIATSASAVVDSTTPEQVVTAFQKIPPYEMLCQDESWKGGAEPVKVGSKFEIYLSKEFFKLFLWSQCVEPEFPPFYNELNNIFYWDIRFGSRVSSNTPNVTKIRLKDTKYQGSDKAIIKLIFDPTNYTFKNITTTYTLIREDGHWKIDDIAPKGDTYDNPEQESALQSSPSIKTDMQNNYNAAMMRYQKEQANTAK